MLLNIGPAKTYQQRQRRRQAARIGLAFALISAAGATTWVLRNSPLRAQPSAASSQGAVMLASTPGSLQAEAPTPAPAAAPQIDSDPLDPDVITGFTLTEARTPVGADPDTQWLLAPEFNAASNPDSPTPWSNFEWAGGLGAGLRPADPTDGGVSPNLSDAGGPTPAFMSLPRSKNPDQGLFDGMDSYFHDWLKQPNTAAADAHGP